MFSEPSRFASSTELPSDSPSASSVSATSPLAPLLSFSAAVASPVLVGSEEAEGDAEAGTVEEEGFEGPAEYGQFSAESAKGTVAIDGTANNGVYLSGKVKPACYFSGYFVID